METLVKRLTIEYNQKCQEANKLLNEIYNYKIRIAIEGAEMRRQQRIDALKQHVAELMSQLQAKKNEELKKQQEQQEKARLQALAKAEKEIAEILAQEQADWEKEIATDDPETVEDINEVFGVIDNSKEEEEATDEPKEPNE